MIDCSTEKYMKSILVTVLSFFVVTAPVRGLVYTLFLAVNYINMNFFIPSYAVLAIHLKWRQREIFSNLTFSVCFMQLFCLLKKQGISLAILITIL